MDTRHFDDMARRLARRGTRRQALKVLIGGGLVGLGGRRIATAAPVTREVAVDEFSSERITGKLAAGPNGLQFTAWVDQMPCVTATTLDGRQLLSIKRDGGDIVTEVGDGFTARLAMAEARAARAMDDPTATVEHVRAATAFQGDPAAVAAVRHATEYALLPGLSYAVGMTGATGKAYLPSLGLHALGLAAATDVQIDPRTTEASYLIRSSNQVVDARTPVPEVEGGQAPGVAERKKPVIIDPALEQHIAANQVFQPDPCVGEFGQSVPCVTNCLGYPNEAQDCFGMCGPGCSECWEWVCGDCCFHQFCADHDAQMRACESTGDPYSCFAAYVPANYAWEGCDGELF
ncbi:MAG: hypothetical protein ACRDJH_26640 [Thermomicrobiales bacterium]